MSVERLPAIGIIPMPFAKRKNPKRIKAKQMPTWVSFVRTSPKRIQKKLTDQIVTLTFGSGLGYGM